MKDLTLWNIAYLCYASALIHAFRLALAIAPYLIRFGMI